MRNLVRAAALAAALIVAPAALAATPSTELGIPANCHSARNAEDAKSVLVSCELALESERDAPTSAERRAWLHFFSSYAHVELGEFKAAETDLRAGIKEAPRIANLHHELCYVLSELGDFDAAETEGDEAIRLEPDVLEHPKERGWARMQKGYYSGAADDYARVAAATNDPVIVALAAYAAALAGDNERARAHIAKLPAQSAGKGDFQELARSVFAVLEPRDEAQDPSSECLTAFEAMHLTERAARTCTRLLRMSGSAVERANALRLRALVWHFSFSLAMPAQSDTEAAVRLNPRDAATVGQRCMILTATAQVRRQIERGIADCTRAVELCATVECKMVQYLNRGDAYLAIKQYPKALADAEAVIKTWPEKSDGYRLRGEAKLRSGDRDGAKADLTRARQLGGDSEDLKRLLAELGLKMEDIPAVAPKTN